MKFTARALLACLSMVVPVTHRILVLADEDGQMVKMCLFYPAPSGHARTDPIINQTCASDHIHTFYGPQGFHPDTTYEDLINTPPEYSTTPWVENQSLYWHPAIYRVIENGDGTQTYERQETSTSPYYRWDNSVTPVTEAFPPGFRMIAYSNQEGADNGGETGGNMLVECCQLIGDEEDCVFYDTFQLPTQSCDFVGIAMAMPTCWDGVSLGDDNDHISHMAFTTDGHVNGDCPAGFPKRVPQIQVFVRILNYQGGTYVLSDESDVWHVDFMNGWEEDKLADIIENCPVIPHEAGDYNPPCNCAEDFLTENTLESGTICDSDVQTLILNEPTTGMSELPRGTCAGEESIVPKTTWTSVPPLACEPTFPDFGSGDGGDDEEEDGDDEEEEDGGGLLGFIC